MMKNLLMLHLLLLSKGLFSQNLAQLYVVGQPEKSTGEFVGASITDANGRICAAVQVVSDMDGFSYQANNGVVRVDDGPGKDMVFLQPDEMVLEILHSGYQPLKLVLNEIGVHLSSREVWMIKISGDKKLLELPIAIISRPEGAEVFIDGQSRGAGEQHLLAAGSHILRLVKQGYAAMETTIQVDEKNTLFRYTLEKVQDVVVYLESEPSGAAVYVDGIKLGVTPLSTFYPAGRYQLRLDLDWYLAHEAEIEFKLPQTRQKIALRENFARLTVTSAPESGLDIYLNGLPQQSRTPFTFERLAPANYRIKARSTQYETTEETVVLAAGERRTVNLISSANFATLTIKTAAGVTVYMNGRKLEQLENLQVEPSLVTLRAELPKAPAVEETVTLRKGESRTVELVPIVPTGTIQVAVTPFEAKMELRGDASEYYTATGAKIFADIPLGTYTLKVSLAGYTEKQETVLLKEGEKLTRSVLLEKQHDAGKAIAGATWREPKTGIEFVLIKGGTFQMGDLFGEGSDDEKPVHTVMVSDFYLGKTEVTVGQFRRFIDATGYRTDAERDGWAYAWSGNSWEKVNGAGWQKPGFAQEDNHPVVCVSWNDAVAFCQWSGFRLPTEAEWEYAGRAGGKKQRYGWGDDPPIDQRGGNVADESAKKKFPSWPIFTGYDDGYVFTAPVAHFVANSLGLYDMTGNVWEWCADWYGNHYYSQSPQVNPQGPSSGQFRVLRGGSWFLNPDNCRACNRSRNLPAFRNCNVGFRVARPAQ